jgi:hypothetical protein
MPIYQEMNSLSARSVEQFFGIKRMILLGMPQWCSLAVLVTLCIGSCLSAPAATITVVNSSFENPILGGPGAWTPSIPGWDITGFAGTFRPAVGTQVLSVPAGDQVAFLGNGASIFQNLGVVAALGETYTLDLFVGTERTFTFGAYVIELLAGNTAIASHSGTNNQTDPFIPISLSGIGNGDGNLGVRITATGGQPLFDEILVQGGADVPEPATWMLVPIGAALLSVLRRSR